MGLLFLFMLPAGLLPLQPQPLDQAFMHDAFLLWAEEGPWADGPNGRPCRAPTSKTKAARSHPSSPHARKHHRSDLPQDLDKALAAWEGAAGLHSRCAYGDARVRSCEMMAAVVATFGHG